MRPELAMSQVRYSVIVPVYNRPQELDELLDSLGKQTYTNFEVLIIEDGSTERSDRIIEKHSEKLNLHYFYKSSGTFLCCV